MHKRCVLGISLESMHSVRVRKRLGLDRTIRDAFEGRFGFGMEEENR